MRLPTGKRGKKRRKKRKKLHKQLSIFFEKLAAQSLFYRIAAFGFLMKKYDSFFSTNKLNQNVATFIAKITILQPIIAFVV